MTNNLIKSMSLAILIVTSTLVGLVLTAPTASAGVSGNITVDTTWSGTVYVEGDVTVDAGVNLTIDPGTDVKFNGFYSLIVNGNLTAVGTPGNRINITSNQSSPSIADWYSIRVNSIGNCELVYCDILYSLDGVWLFNSRNNTIDHCNISYSTNGVDVRSWYNVVTNCTFGDGARVIVQALILSHWSSVYTLGSPHNRES